MADRADQPDRGDHRGQRKQQRDPRGNQRAEGDQQDHEGDREGGDQRLAEVVADRLVELLLDARIAELADGEAWVGGLHGADRRQRRTDAIFDLILGAGDLEAQQGRVAVLRDLALVTG